MNGQCENCASVVGPFYTVQWQSVGEAECYCEKCFDQEMGTVNGVKLPDPDPDGFVDGDEDAE